MTQKHGPAGLLLTTNGAIKPIGHGASWWKTMPCSAAVCRPCSGGTSTVGVVQIRTRDPCGTFRYRPGARKSCALRRALPRSGACPCARRCMMLSRFAARSINLKLTCAPCKGQWRKPAGWRSVGSSCGQMRRSLSVTPIVTWTNVALLCGDTVMTILEDKYGRKIGRL